MRGERGFVVAEMLLAIGLFIGLGFAALAVVVALGHVLQAQGQVTGSVATLDQEIDRMRSDASSAYAVYVPSTDVFGNPNASQGEPGHEVAFFMRDSQNRDSSWAYFYDAAKSTVRRYDFDPNGGVGVRNATTGAIEPGSYSPIAGVSSFSARTLEATDLATAANPYAPLISNVIVQAGVSAVDEPVGFVRGDKVHPADLYGGNTVVQVDLATKHGTRNIHLETAALPSGFTVHQRPSFRVYVYSEKYTTPSGLFGTFKISWQNVYAQLVYSYHPETDPPSAWKRWCDFNLYQVRPNDRRRGGLYVNYQPYHYSETVYALFQRVANQNISSQDNTCPAAPGTGTPQK